MPLDNLLPDSPDAGTPLDLTDLFGGGDAMAPTELPQQPQGPLVQPPVRGKDKSGLMQAALMAMIPIAAKQGGPNAVAALLSGFQQAQARKQAQAQQDFQNARLTQQDARLAANDQANADYRQQGLANQAATRRQALIKEASTAIQSADSPEAVKALLDFYNPLLSSAGVRGGALDSFALQYATPSRLEQKSAQKYITQLEKTYGQDWAQTVGSATFTLPGAPVDPATGKPKPITAQELLAKSGLNMDGLPVKPTSTDKRGFTTKDITVNGKRMLAGFDPDTNTYYAPGDTKTPLTGNIQEFNKPTQSEAQANASAVVIKSGTPEYKVAQQLAYGELTFPQLRTLYSYSRDINRKLAIYQLAGELNPQFNPAQFEAGYKLFVNPQIRQRVVAIDALSPLIDRIKDIAAQVPRGDVQTFNRLLNGARLQMSGRKIASLDQLSTLLGDEVGMALGVGTGSDMKTRLGLSTINTNLGTPAFNDTMDQLQTVLSQRKTALLGTMGPYGAALGGAPAGGAPTAPGANPFRH